ncbi:MAG: hypothetical protein J7452_03745 [Thermoflexus sp.]|jgi:hypothetical protein|nr:hypothetical protein [Thermoflexus sp.]
MDPRIAFHTLQNYRHRGPLIVAMEPDPIPEGLGRWEKAAEPLTQAGAGLFVWTPAGGPTALAPLASKGPAIWILDAYLEPRARLNVLALETPLLQRVIAWIEGIPHKRPE